MEVLVLQIFVSLMLVIGAVALFTWTIRARSHEHADRLALLPIAEDDAVPLHATQRATRPPYSPQPEEPDGHGR